jgi:hypothetical protein
MKKSSDFHVLSTLNCCTSQIHSESKHSHTTGRPPGTEIIHSKACLLITGKTAKITFMPQVGFQKYECND